MRRIISVLAVVGLLAAMLIGAPAALAQEVELEECVLVEFSPGNSGTTTRTSVSVNNAERFALNHQGTIVPESLHTCPVEVEPLPDV